MFAGIVAIILPVGLTGGQRDVLSRGLVSNGAKLLDFPSDPGDSGSRLSPSDLLPDGCRLLKNAARSSSKRKHSGGGEERSAGKKGPGSGTVSREATEDGPTPTHVVCDAGAFRAGRVSDHFKRVVSRYSLKDNASEIKVIGSGWLSECLRLDALQPLGAHLLETVTRASSFQRFAAQTDGNGAKEEMGKGEASSAKKAKAKAKVLPAASSAGKKNPWTASVAPPKGKTTPTSQQQQQQQQRQHGVGLGVGAGPGGARGPGEVPKEAVWRDEVQGTGGKWEEPLKGAVLRWVPDTARVSTHILAFDMDETLIKTKSGKRFGDGGGDWQLMYGNIPSALKAWYQRGYKVAIISNQLGVGKGKVDKRSLQLKVEAIVKALKVPVEVYLACQDDYYRKPRPGCWELLSRVNNGSLDVLAEACLYVGDAAGRPKEGTRKKDFSAGDLKLAINVQVPFQTPEQFFMGSTQRLHRDRSLALLGFDPSTLRGGGERSTPPSKNASSLSELENSSGPEMVVLVGPPAAGKSRLCSDRLPGHFRVNQDELSSLARCRKVAKEHLEKGDRVVIDATNPGRQTRSGWIALAREHGATARCIFLETPKEVCFHLNAFRGCNPWSPEKERRKVPDVVIHTWFKALEPVDSKEGFGDVIRVPFTLREFDESQQKERNLLLMHLLPK
ncbi:unnamed protein product [Ascophyllum nodosum]